jgi:hypothetical protein
MKQFFQKPKVLPFFGFFTLYKRHSRLELMRTSIEGSRLDLNFMALQP